jgi:nucleoside-diphosphate-sugar epimerase
VDKFEMWGDALQTHASTFIDECVEGVLRLTKSDLPEPSNIGSDKMAQEVQKLLKRKRAKADKKMEVENRKKHRLEEH